MRAWAVITVGLTVGCASPQGAFVTDTNPSSWRKAATITVLNADTLSPRDLRIVIRSNEMFREDTMTLHIAVFAPDSLRYEEPFTLRIPPGHPAAAVGKETEIPYRLNAVLADSGDYRFIFTPARNVKGIEAVGLRITGPND